ncbi:hypothetical protein [Streptomyces griseoloalbus]|uniref:Uncharacterized protein n=1 Tax=Streptomyces griseoloalbus TaxID=67303 RepID=A0A7W8BS16_9ACTN|nr:hypothetical protein [Streptomyces albaduncus]MBB5128511.1 hypothetical protein [Streptomyces albaduncus]GGW68410.1 hypothetical protein GCM10010340_53230 [Streptomyces albaduncus]
MNLRVLRIELRRSVAPWAGAVVLAAALAFLYLIPGPWWKGTAMWTNQWTPMALWTRSLLYYLWPLAVGFGALQGLRDHRSKMSELLTSTPRPVRHRAATLTGTTAITLASAFTLLVLVGAVQVPGNTEYTHLGWLPISLVGALSLVAGAVLGMGAGRTLPSALTPPALAMGAFVFTALMHTSLGRTRTTTTAEVPSTEPNQVSLLSPAVQEVRDALVTLSASVHVGQTVWLLGLAATGFALLVAATPRARLLALTPVLAGAALALLVLPSDPRRMYVVDEAAAELVCDGPVCVTTMHQERLDDLAGPGKEALRLLRGALGDQAPVAVRENTAVLPHGAMPQWSRTTVLFDFDDEIIAAAQGEELTRALIAEAMVPGCSPVGWTSVGRDTFARTVAVGWVLGDLTSLPGTEPASWRREVDAESRPAWKELKALPRDEQLARINAMRAAAFSCEGDAFQALNGGASR